MTFLPQPPHPRWKDVGSKVHPCAMSTDAHRANSDAEGAGEAGRASMLFT